MTSRSSRDPAAPTIASHGGAGLPHRSALLLVQLLQVADQWLTFRAVATAERNGAGRVATDALEATPIWRACVSQGHRRDPRFVATVAVTTIVLAAVGQRFEDRQIEFLLGAAYVVLGLAIGRSLSHRLLLRGLAEHLEEIARYPAHSPGFALIGSSITAVTWLVPVVLLLLAQPSILMAGALFGVLAHVATGLAWARAAGEATP